MRTLGMSMLYKNSKDSECSLSFMLSPEIIEFFYRIFVFCSKLSLGFRETILKTYDTVKGIFVLGVLDKISRSYELESLTGRCGVK